MLYTLLNEVKRRVPQTVSAGDFFDYCEAASPTQVVIHMKSVAGPFISQLAGIGNAILPKEEVEAGEKTSVPTSSAQVLSHWKKL